MFEAKFWNPIACKERHEAAGLRALNGGLNSTHSQLAK